MMTKFHSTAADADLHLDSLEGSGWALWVNDDDVGDVRIKDKFGKRLKTRLIKFPDGFRKHRDTCNQVVYSTIREVCKEVEF